MTTQYLQETMENFYLCTHLPIRAFHTHLEEALCTGFIPGMTTYQHELNLWLKSLSPLDCHKSNLTFMPKEHILFTLCPLGPFKNYSEEQASTHMEGYFIIGPYTDDFSLKEDFAFKPSHCMPHLIELLYSIGESHTRHMTTIDDCNYHVVRAQKYIKEHYAQPITLDILASHLGLNKSYLCTIFKQATKDSFCTYTNKVRIEESKKLLKNTNQSITDIALSVGFSSASYFNTMFKKLEGKTPLEYRKESGNLNHLNS